MQTTPTRNWLWLLAAKDEVLKDWAQAQQDNGTVREDLIPKDEQNKQNRELIEVFLKALTHSTGTDLEQTEFEPVRSYLSEICKNRAKQGFSPSETARYTIGLKSSMLRQLQHKHGADPAVLLREILHFSELLDNLGIFVFEQFALGREQTIRRQQEEILEISTPVTRLWDGVLALPLIGTLDSNRTQGIMESLLQEISATGYKIAILDISGVMTVDTLVTQHLLKTVAAARLMGAECIISGIRPQTAQTMVHLGVDLSGVKTKSTLADALRLAFSLMKLSVVKQA
ncbi:MAG: STAS domain-containing protein [Limisphaerales bacterium]